MGIEGNLRDMSLPNLVQILCLEQRQVGLTLKRQSESGAIYFDCGDIVHATVGALEGEDAVYQMLSWPEGSFRVGDELTAPRRTINARWDQLMMEGARRLDEFERDRTTAPAPKHLTAQDVAHDSQLENEIIMLLSSLEQARCRLSEKGTLKRPASALQVLVEMANQTIVAATGVLGENRVEPLKTILSKVAQQFPTAQSLPVQNARLSVPLIVNLFNGVDKKVRQQFFFDACRSIVALMDAYFAQMTSRFRSAVISEGLKEAYSLFLTDLKEVVGTARV
jgi:hypothetical protein